MMIPAFNVSQKTIVWMFITGLLVVNVVTAQAQDIVTDDALNRGYVNVGDPAPDFTIPLTNSTNFTLHDYLGYIILINIWGDY
ncbi:hypothetical protein ACFL27_26505 [candidate division CSSED10-310 bacterium]|uniref:Alkyl hydroperoxide reductase subunit C/ Thiol specific antioxidant domain-containing protein n=1 Tax=candidate division CSSED10-310 bacterium TaxID=2855610 RepID=A0ABV6Z5M4_UNCC1